MVRVPTLFREPIHGRPPSPRRPTSPPLVFVVVAPYIRATPRILWPAVRAVNKGGGIASATRHRASRLAVRRVWIEDVSDTKDDSFPGVIRSTAPRGLHAVAVSWATRFACVSRGEDSRREFRMSSLIAGVKSLKEFLRGPAPAASHAGRGNQRGKPERQENGKNVT